MQSFPEAWPSLRSARRAYTFIHLYIYTHKYTDTRVHTHTSASIPEARPGLRSARRANATDRKAGVGAALGELTCTEPGSKLTRATSMTSKASKVAQRVRGSVRHGLL